MCGYLAAKSSGIDVVDKGTLTVDLDDGEPFPVLRLERGIPTDVDLLELEGNIRAGRFDDGARTLTEMTALCVVQDDFPGARDKCRE